MSRKAKRLAQAARLIIFIIFLATFVISLAVELPTIASSDYLPIEDKLIALIPVFLSLGTVLMSYWVYEDGRKIEAFIEHWGEKNELPPILEEERKEAIGGLPHVCGSCKYFLKEKCPAGYVSNSEIWREQNPCDLYEPK
jgi:hypothetical protein